MKHSAEYYIEPVSYTHLDVYKRQVPNFMVTVPEVNEFYLGELFYFFEFACGVSGYLPVSYTHLIYMCYLLKERKIGKLIVDLDMEGL